YTRSSRHCFGRRQTAYFLRFFSKRWMMGVAPFTNFVPVICSYILIYRFDISSTMSAGASGSLSSLYGSECSLNHKRKNSLSKYSGSCGFLSVLVAVAFTSSNNFCVRNPSLISSSGVSPRLLFFFRRGIENGFRQFFIFVHAIGQV